MDKSNSDLRLLKLWLHDNLKTAKIKKGALLGRLAIRHTDALDTDNQHDPRAFCYAVKGSILIHCSYAIEALPRRARVGILLHETGHILLEAFGEDECEVRVDEWAKFDVPQSGYHYEDAMYISPWTKKPVIAKALECCTGDFLYQLDMLDRDDNAAI